MRNLELKAGFEDLARAEQMAIGIGATFAGDLHQVDTYFVTPRGRLKLRQIDRAGGELIYYERPEATGARWSEYFTAPVPDCERTRDLLARAYGVRVEVEKARRLYLFRGARIHLDRVKGLGGFVEFEVPVGTDSVADAESACRVMDELLAAFSLRDGDGIRASYSELLAATV